jgi:hypothetical protein
MSGESNKHTVGYPFRKHRLTTRQIHYTLFVRPIPRMPDVKQPRKPYWSDQCPFGKMKPGDSFLVPFIENEIGIITQSRIGSAATGWRKYHPTETFTTRIMADGVRCWRTA